MPSILHGRMKNGPDEEEAAWRRIKYGKGNGEGVNNKSERNSQFKGFLYWLDVVRKLNFEGAFPRLDIKSSANYFHVLFGSCSGC